MSYGAFFSLANPPLKIASSAPGCESIKKRSKDLICQKFDGLCQGFVNFLTECSARLCNLNIFSLINSAFTHNHGRSNVPYCRQYAIAFSSTLLPFVVPLCVRYASSSTLLPLAVHSCLQQYVIASSSTFLPLAVRYCLQQYVIAFAVRYCLCSTLLPIEVQYCLQQYVIALMCTLLHLAVRHHLQQYDIAISSTLLPLAVHYYLYLLTSFLV